MSAIETTQTVPLNVWEDGSIRLNGSRVTLDSIVHNFQQGASAEEIVENFGPLSLADVYAAITYYLNHRDEVEEYLRQREAEGDEVQGSLESDPQYRASKTALRERLLAQWSALKTRK